MKCTKCGRNLQEGELFCPICGEKAVKDMVRYCVKCGQQLTSEQVFCSHCGHKVENVVEPATPIVASEYQPTDPAHLSDNPQEKIGKKKGKGILVGVICGIAVIGVILVVAMPRILENGIASEKRAVFAIQNTEETDNPAVSFARETRYKADGSISWWYEHEYDAAGNLIKVTKNNSGSRKREKNPVWAEYEYDAAGNQIKETEYDSDSSIQGWTEWEYNISRN